MKANNPIDSEAILDRQNRITGCWKSGLKRVIKKRFSVFGVGGSGTNICLGLARIGVKKVYLIDNDIIEESNLTRQILFSLKDVGKKKVKVAVNSLKEHSFQTEWIPYDFDIIRKREKTIDIIKKSDFVFSVVDSGGLQHFISSVCRKYSKPMVTGGTCSNGSISIIRFQHPYKRPCNSCYTYEPFYAPKQWLDYYAFPQKLSRYIKIVKDYDQKIKANKMASTFITASIGSNLMLADMINYYSGRKVPTMMMINLITNILYTYFPDPRPNCQICSSNKKKEVLI